MTYRLIDTEIWSDPWYEELSASYKLLFIYLFSNSSCNQAGIIAQFSSKRAAFETGLSKDEIESGIKMFSEAGKVVVEGNKVACVSFIEHQARNGNFAVSSMRALESLPEGTMKQAILDRKARWKQPQSNPKATTKQHESNPSTVQDSTGQLQNTKKIARSENSSRAVTMVDDEFLASLKANVAYAGIDIDREYGKMQAWFQTPRGRGKKPTRARFINWLNKCNPQDSQPQEQESYLPRCGWG